MQSQTRESQIRQGQTGQSQTEHSQAREAAAGMRRYEELILPIVLLLTGLILIGGDRVGLLSLDQIQNLWPLALILVGLSDLLSSDSEESGSRRRAGRV